MKRIVYLTQRFPVMTETFTTAEVLGLAARGLEVEVRTLRGTATTPSGVPVVPVTARARRLPKALRPATLGGPPGRRLLAALRGEEIARTIDPARDHIHAQFPLEAASAGLYAARASGATFSFGGHTYHRLDLMPEKLAAAEFVVVGSEFERGLIERRYGADLARRVEVRRLGVPARGPRGPFAAGTVVSVGTLTPKKGHDVLIEAVALLARDGIDVQLEAIGEGPERAALEALAASLGIEDRVRLPGALAYEEALERIGGAEVFALCSRESASGDHDCLPVALMDAMSIGVPCVSSAAFGIPELIEDGVSGLLGAPGDPEAAAACLRRVLGNEATGRALGAAGRESVRARYALEPNLDLLARLFEGRLR